MSDWRLSLWCRSVTTEARRACERSSGNSPCELRGERKVRARTRRLRLEEGLRDMAVPLAVRGLEVRADESNEGEVAVRERPLRVVARVMAASLLYHPLFHLHGVVAQLGFVKYHTVFLQHHKTINEQRPSNSSHEQEALPDWSSSFEALARQLQPFQWMFLLE